MNGPVPFAMPVHLEVRAKTVLIWIVGMYWCLHHVTVLDAYRYLGLESLRLKNLIKGAMRAVRMLAYRRFFSCGAKWKEGG